MKKLIALLMVLILLILPSLASQTIGDYTPEELLMLWYQVGAQLRENGTYPYVELRNGDTGYEVMALQTRLKELNYYDKEVVPTFGGGTGTAMRRFEKVNNLKINGWASVEDQQLLFKSIALPDTGTTVQPQTTADISQSTFGPLATIQSQVTALMTSTPGSGITPTPATPTPSPALGEPVTAPPVTPTPGLTLGPQVTYKLPTTKIATPEPFVTLVLPIVTPPPFELIKPDLVIPHP